MVCLLLQVVLCAAFDGYSKLIAGYYPGHCAVALNLCVR